MKKEKEIISIPKTMQELQKERNAIYEKCISYYTKHRNNHCPRLYPVEIFLLLDRYQSVFDDFKTGKENTRIVHGGHHLKELKRYNIEFSDSAYCLTTIALKEIDYDKQIHIPAQFNKKKIA